MSLLLPEPSVDQRLASGCGPAGADLLADLVESIAADPAAWEDWLAALEAAREKERQK